MSKKATVYELESGALPDIRTASILILDFSASETMRNKCFVWTRLSIFLLQQPKLTKTTAKQLKPVVSPESITTYSYVLSINYIDFLFYLCGPLDCSIPGFLVLHYLPELAETHVHWVDDAIQPSHALSPASPLALRLSKHQSLFQWVRSSHLDTT